MDLNVLKKTIYEQTTKQNRKYIEDYDLEMVAKDYTDKTRQYFFYCIRKLVEFTSKDFKELTEKDMQKFFKKLKENTYTRNNAEERKLSEYSIFAIKKKIRQFLMGINPECVEWWKPKEPKSYTNQRYKPNQILTKEDIELLLKNALHPRDKALIVTLWESGIRRGELLSMKIGSVSFEENYTVISVEKSKTVTRPIALIQATPYLQNWILNFHPDPRPDNWLWTNYGGNRKTYGKRMTGAGVYRILALISEKAKLKKKFNPHFYRHSHATLITGELNDRDVMNRLGWNSTRMIKHYCHRDAQVSNEQYLRVHGLADKEKESIQIIEPRICPYCKTENPFESKACIQCKRIIDLQTAMKMQKEREDRIGSLEKRFLKMSQIFNGLLKVVATPEVLNVASNKPDFKTLMEDSRRIVEGIIKNQMPS